MLEVNKIYNADCLELMKQLPDKCIDLVLTDPAYFVTSRLILRNYLSHRVSLRLALTAKMVKVTLRLILSMWVKIC